MRFVLYKDVVHGDTLYRDARVMRVPGDTNGSLWKKYYNRLCALMRFDDYCWERMILGAGYVLWKKHIP